MSDYNMKGYLGSNKNPQGEKSPSHKGKCTIDGKDYWISAWVNTGDDNSRYFGLKFQLVEPRENSSSNNSSSEGHLANGQDIDDDVPF